MKSGLLGMFLLSLARRLRTRKRNSMSSLHAQSRLNLIRPMCRHLVTRCTSCSRLRQGHVLGSVYDRSRARFRC